jgi:hypothetical protein
MGKTSLILKRIRGTCDDGKTCPALHLTDRGTVVVQGWALTDSEVLAQLGLPDGADAVEVPAGLVAEALGTWSALRPTGRGTVIVPGSGVTDPGMLRQLRLPATERAVEVPAGLLAEVLLAC